MSCRVPLRSPAYATGEILSWSIRIATGLCLVLLASAAGDEKRISVYSPVADYSLNVSQRDGREYVGVLEILEPLGTVTAKADRPNWKLRFNTIEAQFRDGSNRIRIRGKDFDLSSPFLMDRDRGLVSLDSLVTLLPQFLGIPVVFHVNARRLFIGESGTTYTTELSKSPPEKLVLNFSRPVNPSISTEPGKLRMVFVRDPLLASGPETLSFGDKSIASATFQETNGAAELTIAGSVPLLASFSNDGRTITVAPAPGPNTAAAPASQAPAPGASISLSPPLPAPAPVPPAPSPHFIVMLDASHGGDERGAALSDKVAEKDVTLAFARRLRQELEGHGMLAIMIRDSDMTLGVDQRAATVNKQQPAIYIALHAASDSSGIRIYTAVIPSDIASRGPFVGWDGAQTSSLGLSQLSAAVIGGELRKKILTRSLAAPLRPLNSISTPAIAIEIAPQGSDVADLTSPDYQAMVATAVAAGIETLRPRLEAKR